MAGQLDLSQFGGSSGQDTTSNPSTQLDLSQFGGAGSTKDTSSPQLDLSAFMGSNSTPSASPDPSTGWNGPLNNPIGRWTGANALADLVGGKVNEFENWSGINKINGAYRGISNPNHFDTNIAPSDGSYLGNLSNWGQNALAAVKNLGQSAVEGFNNPDATSQRFNDTLNKNIQNFDPVSRAALGFAANTGTDALSFIPVGDVLKGAGTMLKDTSDFAGATPYIAKGLDTVANAPIIKPAIQGIQDTLGNMFTKNYGTSDGVSSGLTDLQGTQALNDLHLKNNMTELHDMIKDLPQSEIEQIPHMIEGTIPTTPELQPYIDKWKDIRDNGITLPDGTRAGGTTQELNTFFNERPVLDRTKNNYYPLQMDAKQEAIDAALKNSSNKGFSTSGAFNQQRTFNTAKEAMDAGFNPEMNPTLALTQRMNQSLRATSNADFLNQMMDKGIISKEQLAGMKASSTDPFSSYFTTFDKKPTGSSPLSDFTNPSKETSSLTSEDAAKPFKAPLTADVQTAVDKLDGDFKTYRDNVNSQVKSGTMFADEAAKQIKGRAMATAAQKRTLIQGDSLIPVEGGHTANELTNNIAKMRTNYTGKEVTVNGVDGKVSSTPFGKVTVTLKDGTKTTVDPSLIKPKVDVDALIADQKNAAAKASAMEPKPIEPVVPKEQNASDLSDPNNFHSLTNSLEQAQPGKSIVKVNPYYINPADEAALKEHLDPSKPTGLFKVAGKGTDLYNKGLLLGGAPHMHNVNVNGVVLGGAKPSYIKEAFNNIRKGTPDQNYMDAIKSGAVSRIGDGNVLDAVKKAITPVNGNMFTQTVNATKDSLSSLPTSVKDLISKVAAPFKPTIGRAFNASHDLLWNDDAAIRTALNRQSLEGGATAQQAAANTNKFMVDYNNITPFEKKYIKPLIPFYAWKKGNLPMQAAQTIAQTPKYMAMNNINNAISQAVSGQPTDAKGRINSGQKLADGSTTMIDPYISMHDAAKVAEKGILPFAYNSLSPAIKEVLNQGSSLSQVLGLPIQNKFPIYNNQAPLGYNIRAGLAHATNALNPFNSSAILGQAVNPSNFINKQLGVPLTNPNAPGITPLETITKILGGFTGRDNPATDAKTQYYQAHQNQLDLKRFMKVEAKVKANK